MDLEEKILDALRRSGYLQESRVASILQDMGHFVQSNMAIQDKLTGKTREIDLDIELMHYTDHKRDRRLGIRLVIECKNNNQPVVLLTPINANLDTAEWANLRGVLPSNIEDLEFEEFLFNPDKNGIYTQYCTFEGKGNDKYLMASHSDLYESINKLTQYVDTISEFNNADPEDGLIIIPVLLFHNNLYSVTVNEDANIDINKEEVGILLVNYISNDLQQKLNVFVITESSLVTFINNLETVRNIFLNRK